jgi:class 3 adenylate cyclase
MGAERGKDRKIALLQISIKNIPFLEKNLSASEMVDLISKVYSKIKTALKERDAYLYKFTGTDFFIIFDDLENDSIKLENTFYLSKEILDKLKKHNDFLNQNHIPKLEYSMALDYGNVSIGKVVFEDTETPFIVGTPFKITNRAINLNERKNITPLLLSDNIYKEVKHILSEYIISVMGFIKIGNQEIYLYGSYQFNK